MFILNRYLLRQFVQIFAICFMSLTGLYIVIDAFGHLDHFSSHAKATGGSVLQIIAEYYAYRSLDFFDRTSGILAMIAAMFTVTWLQRHQEMTAMMAAGISKYRILRPLLVCVAVVSLAAAANRELVIPSLRDELTRDSKDLGGVNARPLEARFDSQTDILIGGEKVVAAEERIVRPTFILEGELARYGRRLVAETARYSPASGNRPAGYFLKGVTTPSQITEQPTLSLEDRPVIVTPRDASWLAKDELFVVSELSFSMLANGSTWRNYSSARELIQELKHPSTDLGPDVQVAVHARAVQPLMDGTLLMLGLPLMFSRRNRNVFLSIGICLLVATLFSLVTLACRSLGDLGMIRPVLAAWAPLLLFVPVAAAMSQTLRT